MTEEGLGDSRFHRRLPLHAVEVDAVIDRVRRAYEAAQNSIVAGGVYSDADWRRIAVVLSVAEDAASVLDVGVGAGQMANAFALGERQGPVAALDRIRFGRYTELASRLCRVEGDLAGLPFADGSFDAVTCLEVLEHLEPSFVGHAVAELRRVARRQLIVTVPFCEPEPISPHHRRRFVASDIVEFFPGALYTVLDRPRRPWIMVEERLDGTRPGRPTATELLEARVRELEAELDALRRAPMTRLDASARSIARAARRRAGSILR